MADFKIKLRRGTSDQVKRFLEHPAGEKITLGPPVKTNCVLDLERNTLHIVSVGHPDGAIIVPGTPMPHVKLEEGELAMGGGIDVLIGGRNGTYMYEGVAIVVSFHKGVTFVTAIPNQTFMEFNRAKKYCS
jgi:hypothetical protein